MGLAVPFGPLRGVTQPEVGGEVDDPGAALEQFAGEGVGHAMGGGEEYRIAGTQAVGVGLAEGQAVIVPAQVGIEFGDTQAGLGTRGDGLDLHLRVLGQQPEQFDAGVTGAADDSDLDHVRLLD